MISVITLLHVVMHQIRNALKSPIGLILGEEAQQDVGRREAP